MLFFIFFDNSYNKKQVSDMNYLKDNFSVPTLSLSGSRARRQIANVPTKDYSQLSSTFIANNQNDMNLDNKFNPYQFSNNIISQDKHRRPPIFPPKATSNEIKSTVQISSNNLNKNVYLQKKQHDIYNTEGQTNIIPIQKNDTGIKEGQIQRDRFNIHPRDPLIQQKTRERSLQRKRDINRTLFDHKMSRLFEEASFYHKQQQLLLISNDQLEPQIKELQNLKQASLSGYRNLLQGLNALIQ